MQYKVALNDAHKKFTLDQDKIFPPEETVKRFHANLKKTDLDILKSTHRIDNGRLDIPVYFSTCGMDAVNIIGTKKQMGKGGTPAQAEASAVMELAERFSFFSFAASRDNFFIDQYTNVKKDAIAYAWDFLTRVMGLAPERHWVTVFEEDDEAADTAMSALNGTELDGRTIRVDVAQAKQRSGGGGGGGYGGSRW